MVEWYHAKVSERMPSLTCKGGVGEGFVWHQSVWFLRIRPTFLLDGRCTANPLPTLPLQARGGMGSAPDFIQPSALLRYVAGICSLPYSWRVHIITPPNSNLQVCFRILMGLISRSRKKAAGGPPLFGINYVAAAALRGRIGARVEMACL